MAAKKVIASEEDTYHIPKWFLYFASTILIMGIPWATWVSKTLIEINIRQEDSKKLAETVEKHSKDFYAVQLDIHEIKMKIKSLER